jgi:two-component system cell cycle sensor histidine kinase/response regulator CckA
MTRPLQYPAPGELAGETPSRALRAVPPANAPVVTQEGIWITNAELVTTFVNGRVAQLLGLASEEVAGRPMTDFILPTDRPTVTAAANRLRERVVDQHEVRLIDNSGQQLSVVMELRALFTTAGEFKGVRAGVTDVTARRTAEDELRRRETQLRQAQVMAGFGVWEWDLDSDLMTASDEVFRLFEYERPESSRLEDCLKNVDIEQPEVAAAALRHAAASDDPVEYEVVLRKPDGGRRVLQIRAQRVLDSTGRPTRVVGVVQDVSDRRHLEDRLHQAERVSSIGRLAASTAHEFNNILMGVQPFAEVILRNSEHDARLHGAALQIVDVVARGKRVTQEILRFTRTPDPVRIVVDVASWLASAYGELWQIAGDRVAIGIEAEAGIRMQADPHQLRQVLTNLVSNARDAMPDGGAVMIRAARSDRQILLTVMDNGVGMTTETMRMVFEPLFTTKNVGGTGLGLAVAHQIVERHNGRIWAESTVGVGTAFHLLIPAAADEEPATLPPAPSYPRDTTLRRLLLVEDDAAVASGLVAVLQLDGIEVDVASCGLEAAARIESFVPDAVVLDVDLPDIDGFTVHDEIARRWPDLPVLFSTGHGDAKLNHRLLDRPHVGYLVKPYDSETLLHALGKLVGA